MTATTENIPLVKVAMPERDLLFPALESVLYGGMIAEGAEVYSFEAEFARHFKLNNVLATSSGTAALHIAMLLAGVNVGDEVITTSMTAEPTNTTILQVGAIPVFADVNPLTGNLDPDQVEAVITKKTKAICVVHYAGYPAKIDGLRRLADKYGIKLIEDCAHALGAQYDKKPVGSYGDFAIFSFQAIKHMTTVDGGMLIVKDDSKIGLAKKLRWFGLAKGVPRTEVDITTPGFKYNMNNVTATIGLQQLKGIDKLINVHIDNGNYFNREIAKISGLCPAYVEPVSSPSYWLYTLLSDNSEDLEKSLNSRGIAASKLHRPNHLHSVFSPYFKGLPNLETFYKRLVHLPCGWWVSSSDREKIVDVLRRG